MPGDALQKSRRGQACVAWMLIAVGLYVVGTSLTMSVWRHSTPEEGFFPLLLGSALAGLSFALWRTGQQETDSAGAGESINRRKVCFYAGAMFFYAVVFDPLGFALSTAISLLLILRWIEGEGWSTALGVSFGSALLGHVLFFHLLKISLPLGLLARFSWLIGS